MNSLRRRVYNFLKGRFWHETRRFDSDDSSEGIRGVANLLREMELRPDSRNVKLTHYTPKRFPSAEEITPQEARDRITGERYGFQHVDKKGPYSVFVEDEIYSGLNGEMHYVQIDKTFEGGEEFPMASIGLEFLMLPRKSEKSKLEVGPLNMPLSVTEVIR